jgi:hypothetical protein
MTEATSGPLSFGWRALHIVALFAFAVVQPLLDLLGRNPTYFVAHGSTGWDIAIFTVILVIAAPSVPVVILAVATRIGPRVATIVLAVELWTLTALFVILVVKRFGSAPAWLDLIIVLIGSTLFTTAYFRYLPVRSFLSILSPAALLFPALFLLVSPVRSLLVETRVEATGGSAIASQIPVVLIVFDELPLSSLLDRDHLINRQRFPSFAAFAEQAHWFRNASTVAQSTNFALPAILTGRYPSGSGPPNATSYPESLFTFLAGSYELRVVEILTRLCPSYLNAARAEPPSMTSRVGSLLSDSALVYLHIGLPRPLSARLPVIDATWRDFGQRRPEPANDPHSRWGDSRWVFTHFIEQVQPVDRPALYFLHINLPHLPWKYLPSGREYGPIAARIRPLGKEGPSWGDDEWPVILGWQRHLLQLSFADQLLGRIVDRLNACDLYDRSLMIVVADHGASFRPGQARREVTPETAHDIGCVPFFVKLPGQRNGEISEINVETIDILPTIADALGAELPWPVDGRSVLSPEPRTDNYKVVYRNKNGKLVGSLSFEASNKKRFEPVDWMIDVFGSGEDPESIFRIGKYSALCDRQISELAPASPASGLEVKIEDSWAFEEVDLTGHFVPTHIVGYLKSEAAFAERETPRYLAVALNGVIRATTRTYKISEHLAFFAAMVPEMSFANGSNRVEVMLVEGPPSSPVLIPINLGADLTFRLESDAHGVPQQIIASNGRRISVVEGALAGEVNIGAVDFSGWAADVDSGVPASLVLVFRADGSFLCSARIGVLRREIAERFQKAGLVRCGFSFSVPYANLEEGERYTLRFFAVHKNLATKI